MPAWNYGVWPLTVEKLCADELAVRANCVLEAIKQTYLALPNEIDLAADRAALKRWARETLIASVADLDLLLAEHCARSRVDPASRPTMAVASSAEQGTLELAIDQFADTPQPWI